MSKDLLHHHQPPPPFPQPHPTPPPSTPPSSGDRRLLLDFTTTTSPLPHTCVCFCRIYSRMYRMHSTVLCPTPVIINQSLLVSRQLHCRSHSFLPSCSRPSSWPHNKRLANKKGPLLLLLLLLLSSSPLPPKEPHLRLHKRNVKQGTAGAFIANLNYCQLIETTTS